MNDATAAGRRPGSRAVAQAGLRPTLDRRRVLQLMLALPAAAAVVAGCSGARTDRDDRPDPLLALADAARADAALAAAVVAADPTVAARIDPLRAARTEHAAALDAEIVRVGGVPSTAPPSAAPVSGTAGPAARPSAAGTATPAPAVTVARVRDAVAASQRGAAELVPDLPAERVGLVASVAACCATYAAVLA
ncbi:MAG TPA: hypothetical protein VFY38_09030 [Pseudonocardia sp.]|nr:hypothetical protein [Pseudonocardia sp.]